MKRLLKWIKGLFSSKTTVGEKEQFEPPAFESRVSCTPEVAENIKSLKDLGKSSPDDQKEAVADRATPSPEAAPSIEAFKDVAAKHSPMNKSATGSVAYFDQVAKVYDK